MKDTKLILKEARVAIKNKNFEASSCLCKQILKEEPDNYMALVLLGVSYQETGQQLKALMSFKNAVKIDSTNALAWNGLKNYYEKNESDEIKPELVKIYISLLKTETCEKKLYEYAQKLFHLYEFGNVTEIVTELYTLFKSDKCLHTSELAVYVENILSKEQNQPTNLKSIYEECLQFLLSDRKTVCTKYFCDYLIFLYECDRKSDVLLNAKKMHLIFESDWKSLKWICKIFNEIYIESNQMVEDEETITKYSKALLKLEPESTTANFTTSILLVEHKQIFQAKRLLDQVISSANKLTHAWILMLKCCLELSLFEEAVQVSNKLDKLINSSNTPRDKLKQLVYVLRLEVLSRSNEQANLETAIELFQKMEDELKPSCVYNVIRANIKLNNFATAESLLSKLDKSYADNYLHKLLKAQLLHRKREYKDALDLLTNEKIEVSEWWLEIGTLYWDSSQFDRSLKPFLKAVKLNSFDYKAYLFLGNYYKNMNDLEKAKRCLEKSFRLNKSSEVGIELSKIYLQLKNWDSNLKLLQSVTNGPINKKNSWAWIQLGLHFLEQRDYDKSVANLRLVVRIDENNMNCWESLADAYLGKGAYTSALKCYEKVLSKCETSLYPLLQMAKIKQIIGEFIESRHDFEQILKYSGFYVPALKGIAETCLLQAKDCFKCRRLGAARNHAQTGVNYLIIALQQRNDLSCLWKLLGDCCQLVVSLSQKYSYLTLPNVFKGDNVNEQITLEKDDLFILSRKCYYSSLTLVEDNFFIWHDLAVSFLQHSLFVESRVLSQELIQKAKKISEYCATNNPTCWIYWNLLGSINIFSDPPNFNLAQHCFIKAIIANNNSAMSWCNLGTLYYLMVDYKLANEAYSQAQRADPNYVNSWIGQAILAESLSHNDAMDLFRHSTQLGFHQQGALGYAHWICKTLKESQVDEIKYSIHNMRAIPLASDVLTWYTEQNPLDGVAWNLLGILKERMNLKSSALTAFKNSLVFLDGRHEHQDLVRVNYARLLTRLDSYQEAIDTFSKIKEATFSSNCGLALALFKGKYYKESYETYESTLNWLSDDSKYQSELLVALSSMAYLFDSLDATKTLLFQSIKLEKPSVWSFYATLTLGLLHKDFNLVNIILTELQTTKNNKNSIYHFALFSSYFYCLQKKFHTAIRQITKLIHVYPNQGLIWLKLSSVLLHLPNQKQLAKTAANCSQVVTKSEQNDMDIIKVLFPIVLSSLICGNIDKAISQVQKAVHYYPDAAEGWILLAATLTKITKIPKSYKENILLFATNVTDRSDLTDWIKKNKIFFT